MNFLHWMFRSPFTDKSFTITESLLHGSLWGIIVGTVIFWIANS